MDYSIEQLEKIKELASCLTPITDIAVLMKLDMRSFREDVRNTVHPVSVAYREGKAETSLKIRRNELQLADAGSPLVVQLMNSYLINMDSEEDF